MSRKDRIDAFGALSLIAFSAFLGFNQVVIAVVNEGLQPVFFAGLRSAGAALCILAWMRLRGIPLATPRKAVVPGILLGFVFAVEFLGLFMALDLTTVARTSIIFYSMPVWTALGAHFLLPGEGLSRRKALGLLLAFAGVAWAISHRPSGGEASLLGDLCALVGALGWAAVALIVRATPISTVRPETQLLWQLAVSAPFLLLAAPFFGPLVRDLQPIHLAGLAFQTVLVAAAAFLFWLWLMGRYPATGVVSFGFLSPIFGAFFGWALLGEEVGLPLWTALALVAAGLFLINRPPRAQVPQKV